MQYSKHVIFDVDGVLLQSDKLYSDISNCVFDINKVPSDFLQVVSRGGSILFNTVAGRNASKSDIELFREAQIKYFTPNKHLYPGVLEVLAELSRTHILSIVSNKPEYVITKILEKAKIKNLFKIIVGLDSGFLKKPSPEGLLFVKNKFPEHVPIFIGDSYTDYQTAKLAGVDFLYCSYGFDDLVISHSNNINNFNEIRSFL
ncbi:HAD family hydrolase [bacterium]|nr:HAD family hydrolase [bacterium]